MFGTRLVRNTDEACFSVSWTRRARNVRDSSGLRPDFQAFIGSFWDMVCWCCPGRGSLWAQCAGQVRDASWPWQRQPDFQAFLGNSWDSVWRPSLGCVMAMAGMQPDFQAFLANFWAIRFRA
ncbi:Hypothetical predicted protein [Olea europaea subsp. europaea]|uniref:Uncharacterized protein n=1 Tax=Olea europaea subsp. europaea TaxID=158383 RepID=A0A8S0USD3_OLEEU|nr:Hypothetical predicted protein [Olea europaea subsp. europaea]